MSCHVMSCRVSLLSIERLYFTELMNFIHTFSLDPGKCPTTTLGENAFSRYSPLLDNVTFVQPIRAIIGSGNLPRLKKRPNLFRKRFGQVVKSWVDHFQSLLKLFKKILVSISEQRLRHSIKIMLIGEIVSDADRGLQVEHLMPPTSGDKNDFTSLLSKLKGRQVRFM